MMAEKDKTNFVDGRSSTTKPSPLPLADEHRYETFEVMGPAGTVVVIHRDMDTGEQSMEWTTRTQLTPDTPQ